MVAPFLALLVASDDAMFTQEAATNSETGDEVEK